MSKTPYKPTALKILEGGYVSKKELAGEPKPRPVAPKPMPGLSAPEKRAYNTLSKRLRRIGLTTESDGEALTILIKLQSELLNTWARIKATQRLVKSAQKSGDAMTIIETDKALQRWVRQENSLMQTYRRFASEFGLTPRGRVGLVISADKDDGEELLSQPLNS